MFKTNLYKRHSCCGEHERLVKTEKSFSPAPFIFLIIAHGPHDHGEPVHPDPGTKSVVKCPL